MKSPTSLPSSERRMHMTLPVKVGLVGAGVMGGNHARVLARLPRHFAFTGIYDPDTARASTLARQYETRSFPTL
ncbi:MAG: Gfo/Idh/MocA family oxidoreductase, partial [Acidobacteriaceae bacterium]